MLELEHDRVAAWRKELLINVPKETDLSQTVRSLDL